jgi:branched-chain amino acid transport system ATP-binding protein
MEMMELVDIVISGGLRAVHDLFFEIEKGEILGAGKTTAFNLIAGFICPTHCEVFLEGENIVGMKPYAVTRKGIARTFQTG